MADESWGSYFGGGLFDIITAVACDAGGNIYVAGESTSTDFPVLNAVQPTHAGGYKDGIVAKFDAGGQLLWSTYFGGSDLDRIAAITVDAFGNLILLGSTRSADFPVVQPWQPQIAGEADMFLAKFRPDGVPIWATFFGGSGMEGTNTTEGYGGGLTTDASGAIYAGFFSSSTDIPVAHAQQAQYSGTTDGFLLKFSSGGALGWSTYLGGSEADEILGCAATPQGTVAVCGYTRSGDFPLLHPLQSSFIPNQFDGFVAEYDSTGGLLWSTYVGGNGLDEANRIVSDAQGALYAVLTSRSTDLPVLNPIQAANAGLQDIYISKYAATGTPANGRIREWATYLGGSDNDRAYHGGLDVDAGGRLLLSGSTQSVDFPLRSAFQKQRNTPYEMFVSVLNPDRSMLFSSYFGGSSNDLAYQSEFDGKGNIVVAGRTDSPDFPIINGWQQTHASTDGVILRIPAVGPSFGIPTAPVFLRVIEAYATRLLLEWTDLSDHESAFVLEQQMPDTSWFPINTIPANTERFMVEHLRPETEYRFRMKAINPMYESDYSNVAIDTTLRFAPPSNLRAVRSTEVTVTLRWDDQSDSESGFVVESSMSGFGWRIVDTVDADLTECSVWVGAPSTVSEFRVRAVEGSYASAYSNIETAATLPFTPPGQLTAQPFSCEEITLNWTNESLSETAFIVDIRNGLSWIPVDTLAPESTTSSIRGLAASTPYTFGVRAMIHAINSGYGDTVSTTTLGFLQMPTNLQGLVLSSTEVRLDWEDNAASETGYEIWQRIEAGIWQLASTVNANVTGHLLAALPPDTNLAFFVRAVSAGAVSGRSNEVALTTRAAPSTPRKLTAVPVNHHSILLSWESGSGNETGYELSRKMEGGDWVTIRVTGADTTFVTDDNLQQATSYHYRVRAFNARGYSVWSPEEIAVTPAVPIPSAPFGLRVRAIDARSVELQWILPPPHYEDGVQIEESLTGDAADFTLLYPFAQKGAERYIRSGLTPETLYYYRIRSYNSSGFSPFTDTVSVTTPEANFPAIPQDIIVHASAPSVIELAWTMPSDSKPEDGFELQRSLTAAPSGFSDVTPAPGQHARTYTDSGLTAETRYYYRLRAFNSFGTSDWSETVSAITPKIRITPALLAAVDEKRLLAKRLEALIPEGPVEMQTLRYLLGDYTRGYDESAALGLLDRWSNVGAEQPDSAVEALKRYMLFEEALEMSWGDPSAIPPLVGVGDVARQAGRAPAVLSKNLIALMLAWKQQRGLAGRRPDLENAAMEDMVLAVADNLQQLLVRMGANTGTTLNRFVESAVLLRGDVPECSASLMLSLSDFWCERMLGRYYLPSTQPLIPRYALKTEEMLFSGTHSAAVGRRDAFLSNLRLDIDTLSSGFQDFIDLCYELDAAADIGKLPATESKQFLGRLTALRTKLMEAMHTVLTQAAIPVENLLFLSAVDSAVAAIPSALMHAGESIFNPSLSGISSSAGDSFFHRRTVPSIQVVQDIADDAALLLALREHVIAGDTAYVSANAGALRRSGTEMVSALERMQRPLAGIPPQKMFENESVRKEVYGTLADLQRVKTRRLLLSAGLFDYLISPEDGKQANLITDIDSIAALVPLAIDALTTLRSRIEVMITQPALLFDRATVRRIGGSNPASCRLRFAVRNVGMNMTVPGSVHIACLTSGVGAGIEWIDIGVLSASEEIEDSLDIEIDADIDAILLQALMVDGNDRSHVDRRAVAIEQSTTNIRQSRPFPAAAVLQQNYPNPAGRETILPFTLQRTCRARIRVFNLLGEKIADIYDGYLPAGEYRFPFDCSRLPAGVYRYQLDVGGSISTRLMLLVP
ncbi:MAG: fibronectin type III domain-containing protein [Bacteroidia bacterium]|nr:fibronectin type III domain-containing protein [Bacteroidia bacterium]